MELREGDIYFHCVWEYKLISKFCSLISKELSKIFKNKIKKDPGVFLLGLPSRELHLSTTHDKLFEKLLLAAWKCVLQNWVQPLPPSITLWYKELFSILPHERLEVAVKSKDHLFLTIWTPVLNDIFPKI